nr:MAG TPA: hypothetical protein [Caudoviricetes sp.]
MYKIIEVQCAGIKKSSLVIKAREDFIFFLS